MGVWFVSYVLFSGSRATGRYVAQLTPEAAVIQFCIHNLALLLSIHPSPSIYNSSFSTTIQPLLLATVSFLPPLVRLRAQHLLSQALGPRSGLHPLYSESIHCLTILA